MIRQAISCDVCGAEKKQTNHWFVACEVGGELRLTGWNSRMRQRAGARHLCGQTCLHKLVDEFMARTIGARGTAPAPGQQQRTGIDASLTSAAAHSEASSPAPIAIVAMQPRLVAEPGIPPSIPPQSEPPNYASRRWRAEAWERERNRELTAGERHPRHKAL